MCSELACVNVHSDRLLVAGLFTPTHTIYYYYYYACCSKKNKMCDQLRLWFGRVKCLVHDQR